MYLSPGTPLHEVAAAVHPYLCFHMYTILYFFHILLLCSLSATQTVFPLTLLVSSCHTRSIWLSSCCLLFLHAYIRVLLQHSTVHIHCFSVHISHEYFYLCPHSILCHIHLKQLSWVTWINVLRLLSSSISRNLCWVGKIISRFLIPVSASAHTTTFHVSTPSSCTCSLISPSHPCYQQRTLRRYKLSSLASHSCHHCISK